VIKGLGQALIQIAQHIGAEIFATAGTVEKRSLLVREYGIPASNIFTSRDLTFARGVMQMTSGKGVDVIFNSLTGECLKENWDCIAEFGRFIELGIRDILANSGLDMRPFSKSLTFTTVNTDVSLAASRMLDACRRDL
jgi:NADPH:quinone reductase-like Zn-dependent oxidoreductase